MYIDRLDKINDKYINTYHRKVEIKPTDVNVASYTDFSAVHNKKDPTISNFTSEKNNGIFYQKEL